MSKESLKKATASASICGDDLSCCRPAVRRAYSELRQCGQPERYAFEAAVASVPFTFGPSRHANNVAR